MTLTQRTLKGRAGRLAATEAGEGGVPVLFVHGNGGNRTQWAAQQAHLKQRSVAFDMRGMGESEPDAAGRYGCEAMAEDVEAVVEALGWERFVLVGHSFGGTVVGTYAARHPERLAGLVYADAGGDNRGAPEKDIALYRKGMAPETYEAFTRQWFEAILQHARPETHRAVMASLRATPREVFMEAFWSAVAYDPYPGLQRFQGPKLSIVAELLLEAVGDKALHRLVPDVPHRVLSGVSHWLMMDAPEPFNAELEAFLRSL
jgi:pimeloyl-ACP methyl ester carboxylesterase